MSISAKLTKLAAVTVVAGGLVAGSIAPAMAADYPPKPTGTITKLYVKTISKKKLQYQVVVNAATGSKVTITIQGRGKNGGFTKTFTRVLSKPYITSLYGYSKKGSYKVYSRVIANESFAAGPSKMVIYTVG